MKELRLSSGAVIRYRPVPPYARAQAYQSLEDPPPPTEELESVAGHTEEVPIEDPNAPEFQRWVREVERIRRLRAQRQQDMTLDYGIVSWLLPPPDGLLGFIVRGLRKIGIKNWHKKPPRGWDIPEELSRYGVSKYVDRRLSYIQIKLIESVEDLDRIVRVIGGIGEAGELTEEEVEAAEASFRVPRRRSAAARPTEATDSETGSDAGGD